MLQKQISLQTLRRLPLYLNYLRTLPKSTHYVSATQIAAAIGFGHVQVRKDLAAVSGQGRPKTGYEAGHLTQAVENILAGDETLRFCIVGMGHLGTALAQYPGFGVYGLQLAAAFDNAPTLIGQTIAGVSIASPLNIPTVCKALEIKIGIITVPPPQAQAVCDALVGSGIHTIWNFAPIHLKAPEHIYVEHENMAAHLGMLSRHLQQIRC